MDSNSMKTGWNKRMPSSGTEFQMMMLALLEHVGVGGGGLGKVVALSGNKTLAHCDRNSFDLLFLHR